MTGYFSCFFSIPSLNFVSNFVPRDFISSIYVMIKLVVHRLLIIAESVCISL